LGDLRDLLSIFGNLEALTSSAFHRILESYALAIKKLQHEKILAVEHVKKRDTTTIHKLDAGPEISEYICEHCKSPWLKQEEEGKCFACGKTGYRMHKLKDMGLTQEESHGSSRSMTRGSRGRSSRRKWRPLMQSSKVSTSFGWIFHVTPLSLILSFHVTPSQVYGRGLTDHW